MNKRISRFLASDDGMSLTELMVVLVLLGAILASAYAAQQAISRANALAERQATLVQQITNPLLTMEKIIMQNRELKGGSGPYKLVCTTDRDLDGNYELHTITADNDGTIRLRDAGAQQRRHHQPHDTERRHRSIQHQRRVRAHPCSRTLT